MNILYHITGGAEIKYLRWTAQYTLPDTKETKTF
jgi:hypothetical protein